MKRTKRKKGGGREKAYHVSQQRNRESIRVHGLNPDYSDVWRYDARLGRPYPWTWFWISIERARKAVGYGTDIYEVDLRSVTVVSDPHGTEGAIATEERILPSRLRLLEASQR